MFNELELDTFGWRIFHCPKELQKLLDTRIGMNMNGDMNLQAKFQVANSMPVAGANQGGCAGLAVGPKRACHGPEDECRRCGRVSLSFQKNSR